MTAEAVAEAVAGVGAVQASESLVRLENKLQRLSEQFREYAVVYGGSSEADVEEIADDLMSLSKMSRDEFIGLGWLVLLRSLRLKIGVYRLMADMNESMAFDDADEALVEAEEMYRQIERELAFVPGSGGIETESVIPSYDTVPGSGLDSEVFELGSGADGRLFATLMGYFSDVQDARGTGVAVEIPQELLELREVIDFSAVQERILAEMSVRKEGSVRSLANLFIFRDDPKLTLIIVFMACLFLDMEGRLSLAQDGMDVAVSVA